jgi:hypothetical protein
MDLCMHCGAEGADLVCSGCGDNFCRDCIEEGLCPECGGRDMDDGPDTNLEEIP